MTAYRNPREVSAEKMASSRAANAPAASPVAAAHETILHGGMSRRAALAVVTLIAGLDLWCKAAVKARLEPDAPVTITPFFDLNLGYNTGVAFGVFTDGGRFLVLALTALISVAIAIWLWREQLAAPRRALAFVLGGALGNILDRGANGGVTDFLDVHVGAAHFPAFNLADAAITIGVLLLLISGLSPARGVPDDAR